MARPLVPASPVAAVPVPSPMTDVPIPVDRLAMVDATEVTVGMFLVDADYVPYDGAGVVTQITPGPFASRVTIACLADDEIVEARIFMAPRVYIAALDGVTLRGDDREAMLTALAAATDQP